MTITFQRQVVEALNPAPVVLGNDILSWKPFNASPIAYYLRFFGDRVCNVNVDVKGIDKREDKILALLTNMTTEQLDEVSEAKPMKLGMNAALTQTAFAYQVMIHPTLTEGGGLSKTTRFMAPYMYVAFPAYRCEFTQNDSRDEAATRFYKIVRSSQWERPPAPALSARFLRKKSGVKSTGGKRMGIFSLADIEDELGHVGKEDGFMDIENYQRKVVHIERAEGRFEVTQDKDRWVLKDDKVTEWLRVFSIEGIEAADKNRSAYVA